MSFIVARVEPTNNRRTARSSSASKSISVNTTHGTSAAASIAELAEELPALSVEERETLAYACTHHSDGLREAEVTVQVCWDADRLDLGRVGHVPDPERLCTPAARDAKLIDWAYKRSTRGWR